MLTTSPVKAGHVLEIHEITNRLPPLRDDEPPNLRRDIADELLDHLQAALNRDLLIHGDDETSARDRVLARFGDPRQVARQLWFQTMWSKIMMQRLVVVTAVVSMLGCSILAAFVGLMLREQQRGNVALLEQIARLVPAPAPASPPSVPETGLENLKIKVTLGTKEGPPAKGFVVTVSRVPRIGDIVAQEGITQGQGQNHSSKEETIRKKLVASTNADGLVDCGYVEAGQYELSIGTPWYEGSDDTTLTVHPGKDHVEHVVAPEKMPDQTDVSLAINGLPNDVETKRDALVLGFQPVGSRDFGGRKWSSNGIYFGKSIPFLMVIPKRGVWISHVDRNQGGRDPDAIFRPTENRNAKWQRLESPYHFQLPAHEYVVLFNFLRTPSVATPDQKEWIENVRYDWLNSMFEWTPGQGRSTDDPNPKRLIAKPDQISEWTLELPRAVANAWDWREGSQFNRGRTSEPFESVVAGRFPFGIEQPSIIRELRYTQTLLQTKVTEDQQKELDQILGQCREFFSNHKPTGTPDQNTIDVWKSGFEEFENRVAQTLTHEQKSILETTTANLKTQRQYNLAMIFDLNHELSNQAFARQLDLTRDQNSRVQELGNQHSSLLQGRSIRSSTSLQEVEDQVQQVLTPEQRAVWNQRRAELTNELAEADRNRAAKNAIEEASPSATVAIRRLSTNRRRGTLPPNSELPDSPRTTTDQEQILELQKQVESLKSELKKLRTESAPQKSDK